MFTWCFFDKLTRGGFTAILIRPRKQVGSPSGTFVYSQSVVATHPTETNEMTGRPFSLENDEIILTGSA